MLDESNRKPKKIWVDKGRNFTLSQLNRGYKLMLQKSIQQIMKENLLLLKDLLEP